MLNSAFRMQICILQGAEVLQSVIANINILRFKRAPLSVMVQVCSLKVQLLWQFRVQSWTILFKCVWKPNLKLN